MRSAPFTATFAAALALLASPPLQAMGFGKTVVATTLGQRLDFSAALALEPDEQLQRECVFAEVRVGDSPLPAPAVRVTLETAGEGSGARRLRVTTTSLIDEPVVSVEVTAGCNSRISRRFVVFIDPPQVNLAEAPAALPPQAGRESAVAGILEASRNGARRSRRTAGDSPDVADGVVAPRAEARPAPRARRVAAVAPAPASRSTDVAPSDAPRRTAGLRRSAAPGFAAAPSRSAPRLQLDAAARGPAASSPRVAAAATAGSAPASTVTLVPGAAATAASSPALTPELAVAAAAAALAPNDADAAALAKERERIQILEAGLAQLRAESQANQQSLALLQARLREAESDRYANGLVYALAAGLVFFAALAAVFWAVRPRQRRRARWFDAEASQKARAARNAGPSVRPAAPERDSESLDLQDTPSWRGVTPSVVNTTPASIGGLEVTTVLGPESARPGPAMAANSGTGLGDAAAHGRRGDSQSMEALIDLEQQVEFFTVLGQDEAAIALLEAHVHSAGSGSPLPYLTLLELHQRRRDKPAFEVVRAAFYERFGVDAPAWLTGLHAGREIADYPATLARLQALWSTPLHAMQTLDALLFRRSEDDDVFGFDFPAYRDLLFLYAVARELAGHVDTDQGSIDLFLPLGDAPVAHAEAGDTGFFDVDLDVTGWGEEEPPQNLVILRAPGRHGAG